MRVNESVYGLDVADQCFPYDAFPHKGRDGWYVLDRRVNRVAVVNDRPQTGLSSGMAEMIVGMLNAVAGIPVQQRH